MEVRLDRPDSSLSRQYSRYLYEIEMQVKRRQESSPGSYSSLFPRLSIRYWLGGGFDQINSLLLALNTQTDRNMLDGCITFMSEENMEALIEAGLKTGGESNQEDNSSEIETLLNQKESKFKSDIDEVSKKIIAEGAHDNKYLGIIGSIIKANIDLDRETSLIVSYFPLFEFSDKCYSSHICSRNLIVREEIACNKHTTFDGTV